MKKSIFKKMVSLFAVTAVIITSSVSVFAENNYTSESDDCSSTTNWSVGTTTGATHTIADGMLKSERTMFRGGNKTYTDPNVETSATVNFTADGEGGWKEVTDSVGVIVSTFKLNNKTIATGKAQAKFDFKFMGGSGQKINFSFAGYAGQTGVQITKTRAYPIWPDGIYGSGSAYRADYGKTLTDGEWYTLTATLDLDNHSLTYSVGDKAGTWSVSNSAVIPDERWGTYTQVVNEATVPKTGAITGLEFRSGRDQDTTETLANGGSSVYSTSVWYVDNVEVDAYSETNYALENVYRNDTGMQSNKAADGFTFKGLGLTRFTNFADPADAKLITAAYATDGRMEDVLATPLSAVGTTPVHSAVTGDTVKSFIFGMNTATSYMPVYTYADSETTVRKLDFEEGHVAPGTGNGISVTKVAEGDNNVLKFERTGFGSSYHMTYTENGWENIYGDNKNSPAAVWQYLKLDETVTSYEASFKLKFAGHNNPSGYQSCQFNIGAKDSPALIQRKSDGNISVSTDYDGGKSDIFVLGEDEWCEVNIKVTFGESFVNSSNNTVSNTYIDWTFKKDGVVVATFSQTVDRQDLSAGTSQVYIGSRKDNDVIGLSATVDTTNYTTTSSVWYIDDFVVKY